MGRAPEPQPAEHALTLCGNVYVQVAVRLTGVIGLRLAPEGVRPKEA